MIFFLLLTFCYGSPIYDYDSATQTADFGNSVQSTCGPLAQTERDQVLQLHNDARSQIALGEYREGGSRYMPPASNMMKMSYDCDLEQSAADWAGQCRFVHSNASGLGENLYMVVANKPISYKGLTINATSTWLNEFQKYGWDSITLTKDVFYTGIGHATQMVWAHTSHVGCASQSCNGGKEVIVVCHYKQSGNILGENIYEFGQTCSACPSGTTCEQSTGLCS